MPRKKLYVLPRLVHYNYDITRRWYIIYWIWDKRKKEKVRKRTSEGINNSYNIRERLKVADQTINNIKKQLEAGYVIGQEGNLEKIMATAPPKYLDATLQFDFAYSIRKNSIKKTSWRKNKLVIEEFLQSLDENKQGNIKLIRTDDVLKYLDTLNINGQSPSTYNGKLTILRQLFSILEERKRIKTNPCNGLKNKKRFFKKRNKCYSKDEIQTLLRNAQDERMRCYMYLMLYLLTRCNETRLLQIQHINLVARTVYVPDENDKNQLGAYVVIPNQLYRYLHTLNIYQYPKTHYLISNKGLFGEYPTYKTKMYIDFRKLLNTTNILFPKRSLYNLRHTGARLAYENGVRLTSLSQQLRHTSLSMTAVYLESLGVFENEDLKNNMPNYFL